MSTFGAAELLARLVREARGGVLGIFGTAKNVGKTSAVRAALTHADASVAVCSIGRDGESYDAVDGRPKPSLAVAPGMLAITSADCIAPGRFAVCDELQAQSASGALFVVRALVHTALQTRGPRSGGGTAEMVRALRTHGAHSVLCDGALDRMVGAIGAGGIRTIVLATGATLANGVDAIVAETAQYIERLTLPAAPAGFSGDVFSGVLDEAAARSLSTGSAETAIIVETGVSITREAFTLLRGRRTLYVRSAISVPAIVQCAFAPDSSVDPVRLERELYAKFKLPVIDSLRNTVYAG